MPFVALLDHERFEKEMEVKHLTQEELAEQVGISDRHVRNLKEKDTDVAASLLYNISRALDTPMEELLILHEDADK